MRPTQLEHCRMLGRSLLLVVWIGSQHLAATAHICLQLLLACGCAPDLWHRAAQVQSRADYGVPIILGLATAMAVLLVWSIPVLPARFVQYGRFAASRGEVNKAIYVGEGLTHRSLFLECPTAS